jgi:hypothetical protein
VERKTPKPLVPAKIFPPLEVIDVTDIFEKPELTWDQFCPLLGERKMPPLVPAKI